jgi:ell wall binding domain 2 (CWB2)
VTGTRRASRGLLGALLLGGLLLAAVSGCGKAAPRGAAGPGSPPGGHGAGIVATRNTTRLGGATAAEDAAAVALAVYPGLTTATRPQAAVLVDERDWPAALVAATLAGGPLHAPLLYTSGGGGSGGGELPSATAAALTALRPTGAAAVEGAQVIAIGDAAVPGGYRARAVRAGGAAALAVSVEQLASALRGRVPDRVIVTALDAPAAMTMSAAALAAQSAAPILLVERSRLPLATARELRRIGRPSIYLVGPTGVLGAGVQRALRAYGPVARIAGGVGPGGSGPGGAPAGGPAGNAVAVARYSDGPFGWGAVEPGHGLAFASARRPLDGPAAAPLAATGDYAPLLVLESADALPPALGSYLSDLQPGTPPTGPVHGVYNHGWLIGDEDAISAATQARLDAILEIAPREAVEAEPGA